MYSGTRAAVTLIVEELPIVAPPLRETLATQLASGAVAEPTATDTEESNELPGLFAHMKEAGEAANEFPIFRHDAEGFRSEPQTEEAIQAEMPLFRMFQSDIEDEGGHKKTSKWLTIASVVIAIPMLCLLVFLVDKAHSETRSLSIKRISQLRRRAMLSRNRTRRIRRIG